MLRDITIAVEHALQCNSTLFNLIEELTHLPLSAGVVSLLLTIATIVTISGTITAISIVPILGLCRATGRQKEYEDAILHLRNCGSYRRERKKGQKRNTTCTLQEHLESSTGLFAIVLDCICDDIELCHRFIECIISVFFTANEKVLGNGLHLF